MRSAGRTFLSLCGVAVVVGGLAAALTLVLIPLRVVAVTGGIGYCGPGLSSDNAVQVRANPGIVNTGGSGQQAPAATQRQLERVCTSQANGRLVAAAGIAAVALVVGLPMIAVGRRRQDSISASSSGPSSLSSSGTPGSTVWK
jgi:energy-converting hydrogenase Eha subunit A